jgi:large subunit ribosomal protein L31
MGWPNLVGADSSAIPRQRASPRQAPIAAEAAPTTENGGANLSQACRGRLRWLQCRSFHPAISQVQAMKENIHPKYQPVVFQDLSSDFAFLTRSTMSSKETVKWEDGNEYPVIKLDISSHPHPFYTGKQKTLDIGGRVDKFRQRYGSKK